MLTKNRALRLLITTDNSPYMINNDQSIYKYHETPKGTLYIFIKLNIVVGTRTEEPAIF